MTDEPIAIGTRLWRFDENRRVYRDRNSPPIYEEHFVSATIVGETAGTWVVDLYDTRVNKRTLREPAKGGWGGAQWLTDAGRDDAIWANSRRRDIVRLVQTCDVATLKKIAALLEEPTA